MSDTPIKPLPPVGNISKAQEYIEKLELLLDKDKCTLTHSDLTKYPSSSMLDHYRLDLGHYYAEISASKHPTTGQTIYCLLFTNIDKIKEGKADSAILSYLNLTPNLFEKFKEIANKYFERKKREAEEKRFTDAMKPVDELIDKALGNKTEPELTPLKSSSDFMETFKTNDAPIVN